MSFKIWVYDKISGRFLVSIFLPKVSNRNTKQMCEGCAKVIMNKPGRCQSRCSGVFFVNLELISHIFLVFLLLTLNKKMLPGLDLLSH